MRLKPLDRLGDVELGRRGRKASATNDAIEDFKLAEIHVAICAEEGRANVA